MAEQSPAHYTRGAIEVWDFIRDQQLNYHLGNAVKYISRAGKKPYDGLSLQHAYIKDLKKAIHYLENELLHSSQPDDDGRTVPLSVYFDDWEGPARPTEVFDR